MDPALPSNGGAVGFLAFADEAEVEELNRHIESKKPALVVTSTNLVHSLAAILW
jgi:hypothetical protein